MRLTAGDLEIEVRAGTAGDIPLLMSFIRSMAELERLEVRTTEEELQASLFTDPPAAHTLLAFVDAKPAAYVVYLFTFATMVGKRCLWLDDLFVIPELRGRGIGKALMTHLAAIAVDNRCARFEWMVLDWNRPAIDFYRRLGAALLDDWRICRLDQEQLARLAVCRHGQSVAPES
jgi:GNAT superfamily N-acetyltransferase